MNKLKTEGKLLDKVVHTRIDQVLMTALEHLAKKQKRKVSDLVRSIIDSHVNKREG